MTITIEYDRPVAPARSFELCEPDGDGPFFTAEADDADKSVRIRAPHGTFWLWFESDNDAMTIDQMIVGLQALKARWAE